MVVIIIIIVIIGIVIINKNAGRKSAIKDLRENGEFSKLKTVYQAKYGFDTHSLLLYSGIAFYSEFHYYTSYSSVSSSSGYNKDFKGSYAVDWNSGTIKVEGLREATVANGKIVKADGELYKGTGILIFSILSTDVLSLGGKKFKRFRYPTMEDALKGGGVDEQLSRRFFD